MGAVAKRYAVALFEVAKEHNQLDIIEQELQGVQQALAENPLIVKLLRSPNIAQETKKQQFNTIFADKLTPAMHNFMNLLIDRQREGQLEAIVDAYIKKANQERNIEDAIVTTVEKLDDTEIEAIKTQFGQLTKKTVRVRNVVDASILGGMVVQIGDRLFDGSIVSKLNRFKQQIGV